MAMTPFERAVINELQGIKKELHELNKKKPEPGQVDGVEIKTALIGEGFKGADLHEKISSPMLKQNHT